MKWLVRLFKNDIKEVNVNTALPTPELDSEWIRFEDEKPPNEVVLASLDTYDCGWVIDTAWWSEDRGSWMVTGNVEPVEAHLPYTHWRELPEPPKD